MAQSNVTPIRPNSKIKAGAEYVSGSPYMVSQPRVLPSDFDHHNRIGGNVINHVIIDEMLTDPDVFAGLMLLALMAMNEKLMITPAITESVTEINEKSEAANTTYSKGERVKVKGEPHMAGQSTGTIEISEQNTFYGIIFDGMEKEGVHKWYSKDEIESIDNETATAKKDMSMDMPASNPSKQPTAKPSTTPKDTSPPATKDNVPAENAVGSTENAKPAPVNPRVQRAKDIADFCQRQYDRVPKIASIIFQMIFEGLAHGNKVSEQVLEVALRGEDAGRWCLKALKPKPREAVAFVVDAFMNELGMLGAAPGQATVVQTTMVANSDDIIPREKFCVFTYRPTDGDPRGNTALRAALNGWDMKRRTFPEYLLFLMVSAIPGILATVAPDSDEVTIYEDDGFTPKRDENGEPITLQAHQFLLNMLAKMRNHQVGVAPEGTEFTLLEANSEGEVFTKALDKFGSEITMAILFQQLATRDSSHQTKGATGSQARIIDYIVWFIRDTAADMVRYDLFKPMVRYNFGDEDADELLPKTSYGDTEARDWSQDSNAVAQLAPHLTESQLDHVLTQLGIPLPTDAERAVKRAAKMMMQQMQANQVNQDGGDDEGTDGDKSDKAATDADSKQGKAGNKPATTKGK